MTILTEKKLLNELKDKETREIFAAEHVTTGIPFQIHALREKLGLTQAELARKAGMAQERISVLEDPNYEFIPKINTLLKLADVFDVPLIVRFGSWSDLFEWETELAPEKLAPPTFEEEVKSIEERVIAKSTWGGFSFKTYTVGGKVKVINSLDRDVSQWKLKTTSTKWEIDESIQLKEFKPLKALPALPPQITMLDYTSRVIG